MPRRRSRKSRRSGGSANQASRPTKVPFQSAGIFIPATSASGTTTATLDLVLAGLSLRVSAMAVLWKKWRIASDFHVKFGVDYTPTAPSASTAGFAAAMGYYGAPVNNIGGGVNSISDVAELEHSEVVFGGASTSFIVKKKSINAGGGAPWLYCIASGSLPVSEISTGSLIAAVNNGATAAGTYRLWYRLRGVIEFCDPTESTVDSISDEQRCRQIVSSVVQRDVPPEPDEKSEFAHSLDWEPLVLPRQAQRPIV